MKTRILEKLKKHEKDIIIAGLYFSLVGVAIYANKQSQKKNEAYSLVNTIILNVEAGFVPHIDRERGMMTFSEA